MRIVMAFTLFLITIIATVPALAQQRATATPPRIVTGKQIGRAHV